MEPDFLLYFLDLLLTVTFYYEHPYNGTQVGRLAVKSFLVFFFF